ncbi:MAG: hypothetical protein H6832_17175 [Planctomycetes bacterium]|nr:hypothetical protein [Planctomycetota bacterium]
MKPIPSSAFSLVLGFVALNASPLRAQHVFVVDANGGGSHTNVQAAVDAAVDGDWILISTGTYTEHVKIEGKSLWLQGGSPAPLLDTVQWSKHPDGKTSKISNLRLGISNFTFPIPDATYIRGSGNIVVTRVQFRFAGVSIELTGNVSLRDCSFAGVALYGYGLAPPNTGLYISNAALVTIDACEIRGGPGAGLSSWTINGGIGLSIYKCPRVEITASKIVGGTGVYYYCGFECGFYGNGGPGMSLTESDARVRGDSAYTIIGGTGYSSTGGAGIRCVQNSRLVVGGVQVIGGGGSRIGAVISTDASSRVSFESKPFAPYLTMRAPFRLGADATLDLHGQPQHAAIVLISHGIQPIDITFGTLYVDIATVLFTRATTTNAQGVASFTIPTGTDPDLLRVPLFTQGVEVSPAFDLRLTNVVGSIPSFW